MRKKEVKTQRRSAPKGKRGSRKHSSFLTKDSRGARVDSRLLKLIWLPAGRNFRSRHLWKPLSIRVSKDLAWILPFLEKTHQTLPRLQLPLRINSFRPSLSRRLRTLGTSYYDEGIINLASHFQIIERRTGRNRVIKGLRKISRKKILETLAHELAHLHVVEHNYEHAELTRTIFRTFEMTQKCPHCRGEGRVEVKCDPF